MNIVIEIEDYNKEWVTNGYYIPNEINGKIAEAIINGKSLDDVLNKIRAEIERLHHHPKLDFIKNDEIVEMALNIIDKYKTESELQEQERSDKE